MELAGKAMNTMSMAYKSVLKTRDEMIKCVQPNPFLGTTFRSLN